MAADPAKYKEAVSRLRDLSPQKSEFAALLNGGDKSSSSNSDPSSSGPEDALSNGAVAQPGSKATVSKGPAGIKDIYSQLEAFIMQTFIQSMLPKEAPSVYGKGTAGDVWKSMLAEKMGTEVARSGQLGIAKRLAASNIATGSITTSTIARQAPPATVLPASVTMASLSGRMAPAPSPAPANFAKALTALQETQASQQPSKVLHAWVTTVQKEQG